MVLRMVEHLVAQSTLHGQGQIVAVAGFFHIQVFLGQFQDLVPVFPGGLDVQADHPLVIQLGSATELSVIRMVRRTQRPGAGGEESRRGDDLQPGLPELERQQDQEKKA